MRIQHNIAALNSYRQLGSNNNAVSKNLEKLSSGFRINRAGDDASGLAVSEKMRAQITGLETAQKNAQDGISLVQTAEGNLTEVHSMLNRMIELATQSANGTYQDAVDRENIQKEVESLKSEIDRIAESANYNGIKLLDGSLAGSSSASGVTGSAIAKFKGATGAAAGTDASTAYAAATKAVYEFDLSGGVLADGEEVTIGGVLIVGADGTVDADKIDTAVADDAAKQAAAMAAILNGTTDDTKLASKYDWTVDGDKLVATAKTAGVPGTDALVDATGDITPTADAKAGTGTAAAGIDYFQKDTINVDGTEVSVDWSKLTENDRKLLQKNWTDNSATADDVKKAAEVLQNTINKAIKDHNSTHGTNIQDLKVEGEIGAAGASDSFTFTSGQKDGNSKISFTGGANTVLGQVVGGAYSATPATPSLNINPMDVNGKFTMKLGDQEVEVDLAGLTAASTSTDLENALNTAINNALTNYDTTHGLTGDKATAGKLQVKINADGALEFTNTTGSKISFTDKDGGEIAKTLGISVEGKVGSSGGLVLQVGDTSESYQQVTVSVGSMSAESLGIDGLNVKNQEGAKAAIDKIKAAINTVSSTRGDLGAIQNRLDHTINNLGVTSENMTAAESRIRDVDMAKEMMDFTKNNILSQAAQAMLAQANQIPQGVLQLLQ